MLDLTFTPILASPGDAGATYVTGINAAGQVIGWDYGDNPAATQGFVDTAGSIVAITVPGATIATPTGIDDAGEIVGSYYDPAGGGSVGGFVVSAGGVSTFSVPGGSDTAPVAIDAAGQITGSYENAGTQYGFLDTAGHFATIAVPGAIATNPTAINNAGQVTGQYTTADGVTLCFLDTAGTITTFGVAGATLMDPLGINDSGEIVGFDTAGTGPAHGFIADAGTISTLDVPGAAWTQAVGVNDAGEIVGNCSAGGFADVGGIIATVNVPGAASTTIVGVNAAGDIAGNFTDPAIPLGTPAPAGFIAVACFCAGTRIAAEQGWVAVQALRVGDRVTSVFGGTVPVVWIGQRRIDCRRHERPDAVWPVRVRAGAFADRVPARDLLLSPDHAVYCEDVLIPIRCLINGVSVTREPVETVSYFHVELPAHDIILAEGLPAESYLDTGNRWVFDQGGSGQPAPAGHARRVWLAQACAMQVTRGPVRATVAAQLRARAMPPRRQAA